MVLMSGIGLVTDAAATTSEIHGYDLSEAPSDPSTASADNGRTAGRRLHGSSNDAPPHRYDPPLNLASASASSGHYRSAPRAILPKPNVGPQKLRNIVDDLYKGTTNFGRIGNGTTADALRYELSTGERVFGKSHLQKAEDSLRGLENWLKANPNAPYHDRLVARSLADDLLDALGRAP
jgi:hypothetical protein